jgi:hypothetical protein
MTFEREIRTEWGKKGERANLRTTAKGAHVGRLNGLQIDCGTREIQGRVKERKERRTKRAGNEEQRESVEGGERSNRMREREK